MTGFEMFMFGSVALMYTTMFIFGIICLVKRNDIKAIRNVVNDNQRNVETDNQRILCRDNNDNIWDNRINSLSDTDMGINHGKINSRYSVYENGEITNLCAIIALKNVKREMKTMLTPVEIDAIDKAIDNVIKIEKINAFVESNNNGE